MNKKVITLLILMVFLVQGSFAQGLFSSSTTDDEKETDGYDRSGLVRAPPGGGGVEPPGTPVGEGLLILTALAGGYSLIRNKKSNKQK